MALLEADVNYKVAKEFIAGVTERAMGQEVMESLTPAQQVIKIVNDELTALMGGSEAGAHPHQVEAADGHHDVRPAGCGQNHTLPPSWPSTLSRRATARCWSHAIFTAPPQSIS